MCSHKISNEMERCSKYGINMVRVKLVKLEDSLKRSKLCEIELPEEESQNNGNK